MIWLINSRGIATEMISLEEAEYLLTIHGGNIAIRYDPSIPKTIAWTRVLAEADEIARRAHAGKQLTVETADSSANLKASDS